MLTNTRILGTLVALTLYLPAPTGALRKQSYLDLVLADIPPPSSNEVFKNFDPPARTSFYDQDLVTKSLCPKDQDVEECNDQVLQAAPDTKTPAEKLKEKLHRDKQYEKAMKEGESVAQKELKANGGPDPHGGFFVPNIVKFGDKDKKDKKSKPRPNALAEKPEKGKNKKKGKGKEAKEEKKEAKGKGGKKGDKTTTTTEGEVDVATAPSR